MAQTWVVCCKVNRELESAQKELDRTRTAQEELSEMGKKSPSPLRAITTARASAFKLKGLLKPVCTHSEETEGEAPSPASPIDSSPKIASFRRGSCRDGSSVRTAAPHEETCSTDSP